MKKSIFRSSRFLFAASIYKEEMKMENDKVRKLARIIIQVRLKSVSDEDRTYLNDWLDESEKNRAMYRRIVRGECIARRLREENKINKSDYIEVEKVVIRLLEKGRRRKRLRVGYWGGTVAACLIGIVFYVVLGERERGRVLENKPVERLFVASLPVDRHDAVLVLADGSEVDLVKQQPKDIRQENVVITGDKGQLTYRKQEKDGEEEQVQEIMNKVITGKEGYFLVLSDGTRVWLNGDSELEFPVSFAKGERVVKFRGEAYFEVAKDAEHPFIVKTKRLNTRVLGTSFNVKAYDSEPEASTTLLSGRVEVSLSGETDDSLVNTILSPGMQARVRENRDEISVRKVVAEDVLAWRQGKFIFTDEDMSVVLHTLARWYGVNFIREGKGENYTFSGVVNRGEQLLSVLEMLTLAGGPRFEIKGNNVYIREK